MFTITAQPAWLEDLSPDAQRRLSRNNEILVEGRSESVVSPAMKDLDDSKIVEFVENLLDDPVLTDKLVSIEESNLSKLGPRSIAKPWVERRESLKEHFTSEVQLSESEFEEEVRVAVELIALTTTNPGIYRLRPVSVQRAVENLESSTASGLPFMQKKGTLREQGLATEEFVDRYPCVIYTRTQEGGKTRNVMGVGISDVIREMRYHQAFLPIEKRYPWRSAIVSPTAVDTAVSNAMHRKGGGEQVICLDFSAYDASVGPQLSGRAFAFIAAHFNQSYHDELYRVYERFCTIPFYTPDGEYSGFHGVPSGSAFTNTIDSIAQFLIAMESGVYLHESDFSIQGDDGLYIIRSEDVEQFIGAFGKQGLKVNEAKSDFFPGKEGVYLQRYYHDRYQDNRGGLVGVYSIARCLLRLKYLERFVDEIGVEEELSGSDYFTLRAITILENCKHHPHFETLVDFVRTHDKFGLNVKGTNLRAFEKHKARRSRTEVTNQYGDQAGIESFETWKYLTR